MMAERRFTVQTEPRGASTMKPILPNDDSKSVISNLNASVNGGNPGSAERRQSISVFRRLSMSMGQSRNSSMSLHPNQPRPNTYRMEPENEYHFRPYRVQSKVLEVIAEMLKDQKYDPTTVHDLIKNLSRNVHQLMKKFQLPRYKIIIETAIGQKLEQLIRVASRCLWDPKTDNMVSVNYETKDMVAVVTIYAVYCE